MQPVKQLAPLQMKFPHGVVVEFGQLPAPSQEAALVVVPFMHIDIRQLVPEPAPLPRREQPQRALAGIRSENAILPLQAFGQGLKQVAQQRLITN